MPVSIPEQLAQAAQALALGLILGALYFVTHLSSRAHAALDALFALSFLTVPAAILIAQLFDEYFASVEQSAPVLFALALIPAASLICGLVLRRKGYSGLKNIVAGLIFTLLLCFYGFLFAAPF